MSSDGALLRQEVLACQERSEALRVEADEAFESALFWASLRSDCCTDSDATCDDPLCYRAWREYPDG